MWYTHLPPLLSPCFLLPPDIIHVIPSCVLIHMFDCTYQNYTPAGITLTHSKIIICVKLSAGTQTSNVSCCVLHIRICIHSEYGYMGIYYILYIFLGMKGQIKFIEERVWMFEAWKGLIGYVMIEKCGGISVMVMHLPIQFGVPWSTASQVRQNHNNKMKASSEGLQNQPDGALIPIT